MTYAVILKFNSGQSRHPAGTPEGGRWSKGLTPGWSKAQPPREKGLSTGTAQRNYIAALSPSERARIKAVNEKLHAENLELMAQRSEAARLEGLRKAAPPDRTPEGEYVNSLVTPIEESSSSKHKLGGGINVSLVVEIDGKSYVFKPEDGEKRRYEYGPASLAEREVLASRLDMELHLGLVPPTVMGDVDGNQGSLQNFVADAALYDDEGMAEEVFSGERGHLAVLDVLLGNEDRHGGNAMVKDGKLYAIDHGYTFTKTTPLKMGQDVNEYDGGSHTISSVGLSDLQEDDLSADYQRELAQRIKNMDVKRVFSGSNLNAPERKAFEVRRKLLIHYLEQGNLYGIKSRFNVY